MRRTYSLVNNACDDLEVWVELWADLYVVPRGAKITFRYAAEGEIDLFGKRNGPRAGDALVQRAGRAARNHRRGYGGANGPV